MNIEQVNEILRLLKTIADSSTANKIAAISMIVSGIAVLSSIYFNHQTRVQYIESRDPLLSFELNEIKGILFLTIINNGQSYAKDITIVFDTIKNNGEKNKFEIDDIFKEPITLYPTEKITGVVAISGANVVTSIAPIIQIELSYIKGNTKKKDGYTRCITLSETIDTNNFVEKRLEEIDKTLKQISRSNNRVANYLTGNYLLTVDEMNFYPQRNLYQDIKDGVNNKERPDEFLLGRDENGQMK